MNTSAHIAKHLREVYFGGNWTWSSLKEQLADVTWQQATTQVHTLNTIGALVYHIGYYTDAICRVLQGKPIDSDDKLSFNLPPIESAEDWQHLLDHTWAQAEICAALIAQLPQERLEDIFVNEKYGIYYRNLHGLIEHTHYHLGQIALLKKLLAQTDKS